MPRVYIGDSEVMPILSLDLSEITWLTTQLQVINPLMSKIRIAQVLNRSLSSTHHDRVILINQLGSISSEL